MSLLSWLKKSETTKQLAYEVPKVAGLPDPNAEDNAVDGAICESANKEIEAQIAPSSKGKKRKRVSYNHYDAVTRLKIAKSACDIGLTATARKFSKTLSKRVAYTTVQSIRNDYWKKLREDVQDPIEISSLPQAKRGRPLLIGEELDSRVLQHIMAIRKEGGCVSLKIILGAAIGILKATHPSALKVNGGPLSLTKHWAKSFATRHKLVKRKATKAAKKIPSNSQEVKDGFCNALNQPFKLTLFHII